MDHKPGKGRHVQQRRQLQVQRKRPEPRLQDHHFSDQSFGQAIGSPLHLRTMQKDI